MPVAGLHFCVGLDFVIPSGCNLFLSKHHHYIVFERSGIAPSVADILEDTSINMSCTYAILAGSVLLWRLIL
jgi:hypothetical protein